MSSKDAVAVVLPAYNEAGNLTPLVTALVAAANRASLPLRIIVVDDGSSDGTADELSALSRTVSTLFVVRHAKNRGLAAALKTGIAEARRIQCASAVFMDSDLSHDPDDVPRLVEALSAGADVALGSRFVPGGGMSGVPLWRMLISRAGNWFGRVVLHVPFADLTTGYRAMRRGVLDTIVLGEDGFAIQLESVVKAHAAGFRVTEVPIVLGVRRHGTSHMTYSLKLFRDYWRLLQSCRQWVAERRP